MLAQQRWFLSLKDKLTPIDDMNLALVDRNKDWLREKTSVHLTDPYWQTITESGKAG